MFSHVTFGVSDLDRSGRFYDAVLFPLGLERRLVKPDGGPPALCWHDPRFDLPRFYAYVPFDGQPCSPGNGSMVAFLATSRGAVERAHAAGLDLGGADDGAPGPRSHYEPDYFGAYIRDLDGNKLHIVYRAALQRPRQQSYGDTIEHSTT